MSSNKFETEDYKKYKDKEFISPRTGKRCTLVETENGESFILYPEETIVDIQPGKKQVSLTAPKKNQNGPGSKIISRLRLKKGCSPTTSIDKKEQQRITEKKKETTELKRREKKQLKDISKLVRELLSDPELVDKMIKKDKRPAWVDYMEDPNGASLIIANMIMRAMRDDAGAVPAAEFLRKTGWGDKVNIDVTGEVSFFQKPVINFEVVEPEQNLLEDENSSGLLEAEIIESS